MTEKGDTIERKIIVDKVKKGVPTVLIIEGKRYVLEHKNQYKG